MSVIVIASRIGDDLTEAMATEGQTIVRLAAGEAAGRPVEERIRQAARTLGYPANSWRIYEAWHGGAGYWSAQAMEKLQNAYVTWQNNGGQS